VFIIVAANMNEHIEKLERKLIQLHTDSLNLLSSSASADNDNDNSNENILSDTRVKTMQEVQHLTNLIHSLYQRQYHLETDIEKEYKEKCEKLKEYDFQASCMEEQLRNAIDQNYDTQKNTERENSKNIQENKGFIAALLQCEDIEIRNYMKNVYDKFEKVYTENMEIESTDVDIKPPTKIDLLEHPKLLLLFWYKILHRECNQTNNQHAEDSICVDVSEIVSSSSLSGTTTSISTSTTNSMLKQEGAGTNHVDTLSFRTLYNNMAVKINISIVNRNIKNIHFNSDPFLPNLNTQMSNIIMHQMVEDNTVYKQGGELDIVKIIKSNIWSLIRKRLSLRDK
jgi:hypothetical protein